MSEEHERATTVIREDIVPWMAAMAGAVRVGLAGLTRVRVEGFSKIMASALPASGFSMPPGGRPAL